MTLSLASQWKLVAAGLMAHADEVIVGEECERLMVLVEEEVDGDEYGEWLSIVSDPDKLRTTLASLAPLPAADHRAVLEEAWMMAVIDGVRHPQEIAMLETLGETLGVESVQLEFWREAWAQAQNDRAETTVRTLATLLASHDPAARTSVMDTVLFELPTTTEHRDALAVIAKLPQTRADVVQRTMALSKTLRYDVVARVANAIAGVDNAEQAQTELRSIATEAGLSEEAFDKAVGVRA
ncbi:MAG: hypothetical protein JKY37_11605 [Nannocystaceae bacterium]|nr:hypothetical protein [Nannocystaceae bacterium]